MIGRQRAMARRERRAVLVGQLLRVQLHRQAERAGGAEHALGLRRREADRVAERVDGVDQSFVGERRQHVVAHGVDVVVGPAGKFRRQRMRAEESRAHAHREHPADRPRDAQHLRLGVALEPVARLDLQRRHALGQEALDARRARRQQIGLGRGARRPYGRGDAAAAPRDLLVRRAVLPLLELVAAIAGVDDVRVAVDQPRQQPAAAAVVRDRRRRAGRDVAAPAQPRNAAVPDADRAIADLAVARRIGRERRQVDVDPQRVEVVRVTRHRPRLSQRGTVRARRRHPIIGSRRFCSRAVRIAASYPASA